MNICSNWKIELIYREFLMNYASFLIGLHNQFLKIPIRLLMFLLVKVKPSSICKSEILLPFVGKLRLSWKGELLEGQRFGIFRGDIWVPRLLHCFSGERKCFVSKNGDCIRWLTFKNLERSLHSLTALGLQSKLTGSREWGSTFTEGFGSGPSPPFSRGFLGRAPNPLAWRSSNHRSKHTSGSTNLSCKAIKPCKLMTFLSQTVLDVHELFCLTIKIKSHHHISRKRGAMTTRTRTQSKEELCCWKNALTSRVGCC